MYRRFVLVSLILGMLTVIPSARADLLGHYYFAGGTSPNFGALAGVRVDPNINFNWGTGDPGIGGLGVDHFAISWRGRITVPNEGVWTFYTAADDGSRIWIDGDLILDNWVDQGPIEVSGQKFLTAGTHDITVDYYEHGGGASIQVLYEGPGVGKQIIPASAFSLPRTEDPGILGRYTGITGTPNNVDLPDFTAPFGRRVDANINSTFVNDPILGGVADPDFFAVRWTGRIFIPTTGTWTLSTFSDDGARLFIDENGDGNYNLVVNQWLLQGGTQHSATRFLGAGFYNIIMEYFENAGGQTAQLQWAGPGVPNQVVPPSALFTHNQGLISEHYPNTTLSGVPRVIRNDYQVNFNWGLGHAQDRLADDNFSIRWRGKIEAPATGNYTFYVASDDGADLYINNQLLVNRFGQPQGITEFSGSINLEAGRKYYLDLQYVEFTGGADAELRWSGPGIPKQIIPRDVLFPILNEAPTDITISGNTVGDNDGANTVVGLLGTVDPDNTSGASPLQTHTYALVAGAGDTHNNLFNLNGPELRINAPMTAGTYSVRIQTTDNGIIPDNLSFAKALSIVVEDRTPPVISLIGGNPTIECGTAWTELGFTATDNVDGDITANVVISGQTVNVGAPGIYVVRYNVSDAAGNDAAEQTRSVTVVDTTAPVIALNGASTVNVECDTPYTDLGATASDTCAGDISGAISVSGLPIDTSAPGQFTVTYNVVDPTGNPAVPVTRTVNVVDTTAPVITLSGASVMDIECGASFNDPGASASDSCEGDLSNDIVVTGDTVDTGTPGTYLRHYNVSDGAGNPATQVTRTVNVADTLPPVITLNGSSSISVVAGQSFSDPGADAVDACEGAVAVVVGGDTVDTGTVGQYIITYDAEDSGGRAAAQVTRTVNVVAGQPPVITLLGSASVTVECGDTYDDDGATAFDPEDGDVTADIVTINPVDTGTPGVYTVRYNVTDSSGNQASEVTRTVTVEDTEAPVISLNGSANMTVQCGVPYVDDGATATDACAGDLTGAIQVSGLPVNTSQPGVRTITYTVTDPDGNAATPVTRTVTVEDNADPVISLNGPSVVTVDCGGTYADLGATAADQCNGDLTGAIQVSGLPINTGAPGTHLVTYNVTDLSGNAATPVTRTVVVEDTVPPVITLAGQETIVLEVGDTYVEPGAFAIDTCEGTLPVDIGGDVVDTSAVGTYVRTYDASDSSGNAAAQRTRTIFVTAGLPPIIIQQPEDTTVNFGADATFTVVAAGLTTLEYQWFRNGVPLPDNVKYDNVDTPTLTVRNAAAIDQGAFTCEVRAGAVTLTEPAQLTVNDPGIVEHPEDWLVGLGSTVTFEVVASGSGTLEYQWQRNGINLTDTGAYTGTDTAELTITDVDKTLHEGNYRCVVTGPGGSATSDEAELQIGDPIIVSQPTALAVNPGTTAQFSVVAEGDETLALVYQWQRNGVNVQNSARISGANSPDLVINDVELGDQGTYTCRVVGQNIVVSQGAFLTVNAPPTISSVEVLPGSGVTSVGGNASLTVIVASGAEPFNFQWQRNGVNLAEGGSFSGVTSPTLSISVADVQDGGLYRCVVANVAGTVISDPVPLTIGLTMTTNLFPALAEAGRAFTWSVGIGGNNGPVAFQWYKDDGTKAFVALSDGPGITGTASNNLVIDPVDFSDSGQYQVVASDNLDIVPSSIATLTVVEQLPATSLVALALLGAVFALAGTVALRRRRLEN